MTKFYYVYLLIDVATETHKPEKFENMRRLFCFQAQELPIVNWRTFYWESPLHYFLMILILRDFFRSFVTLYKMWDCFCKLFYHLSVKIHQEQSSLTSYATSTMTFLPLIWVAFLLPLRRFVTEVHHDFPLEISGNWMTGCKLTAQGLLRQVIHEADDAEIFRQDLL